jgi:hypothetical protein
MMKIRHKLLKSAAQGFSRHLGFYCAVKRPTRMTFCVHWGGVAGRGGIDGAYLDDLE